MKKKTMKEQKVKRQRKTKKNHSIAQKNLVRGHLFIMSAKNV